MVGRQVVIDELLAGQIDRLERVREDEPVDAHHDRDRELLGEAERHDVQPDSGLVVLRVQLYPACVPLAHRVAVVVPDVDRCANRPVRHRHHDRQAEAGGVVQRLRHEQQPLARRRGVGASARRRRADRRRHGAELGLDGDEFARERAGLGHRADGLDDVGLRRNRIGGYDGGPTPSHGLGDRPRSLNLLAHGCPAWSCRRRRGLPRRSCRRRCRRSAGGLRSRSS